MTTAAVAALVVRCVLVLLFLPFSALDKVLSFNHAISQCTQVFRPKAVAIAVLLMGLTIEVVCSIGVVSGIADRAAALIVAGYCAATALLYKRFWQPGDFWSNPDGQARNLFWDFLKNMSLGGGFLLIVVGTDGSGLKPFLDNPLASSKPYTQPSSARSYP